MNSPKALKMADDLDTLCDPYDSAIAAELRRLEKENEALRATQAELVEALSEALDFQSAKEGPSIHQWWRWRRVRDSAALAPQTLAANAHEIQAPPATPEQRKRLADSMRQVFGGVALEQPEQEAENEQLRQQNTSLDAECARLEVLNVELVEALRTIAGEKPCIDMLLGNADIARAALAKVEESK